MSARLPFAAVLLLAACTKAPTDLTVTERVVHAPARITIEAEGVLKSAKATPLTVPGQQWSQRQLAWALPDGSRVKQGDLVARFAAESSKLQLATALVDLQRNTLARAAKEGELDGATGKLEVDLSQVEGLLAIARRYAGASDGLLARNTILDAVQDEHFLGVKEGTLNWQKSMATTRGKAEFALIDAQRAANDKLAGDRRSDLAALELKAPHDGLVVLEADWSGEKPRVGASMWAGNNFATLPDTQNMEVELALPQSEAGGLKEGQRVELAPLGAPEQKVASEIAWIAAAAAPRGRDSPVKYLSFKAKVDAAAVAKYAWTPGQRFRADIVLLDVNDAITVPNIAVRASGETSEVSVRTGGGTTTRAVKLGVRGPARSQVLDGLSGGDEIVLAAPQTQGADSGAEKKPAAAAAAAKEAAAP